MAIALSKIREGVIRVKKRFFAWIVVVLALTVTASISQDVQRKNQSKLDPIEVVEAYYLNNYKYDGKVYLVVQRLGIDKKEPWAVSKKILSQLVQLEKYEFTIQGYPGGYTILNITPITTD